MNGVQGRETPVAGASGMGQQGGTFEIEVVVGNGKSIEASSSAAGILYPADMSFATCNVDIRHHSPHRSLSSSPRDYPSSHV